MTTTDDSHDALNNILAAKGYTAANGMTADGDAAKVYSWNQAELDTTTYKMSRVDNTVEVTNQFDNADSNYYGVDFTYLSRSDWSGTYPVSVVSINATDEMINDLNLDWYETPADPLPFLILPRVPTTASSLSTCALLIGTTTSSGMPSSTS